MRRMIFLALGVLEILSAAVLFGFVWLLPGPGDVHEKVGRIERVSRQSGSQVRKLRDEVHHIRQGQAQVRDTAEALRVQLQLLSVSLKTQIDYTSVNTLHDALGEVARILDGLADHLAPDGWTQFSLAVGISANFFDTLGIRHVVRVLRSGREGLDKTLERWPEWRQSLRVSAEKLRLSQRELRGVLQNRPAYEASLKESLKTMEALSAAVPMYTNQWGKNLEAQESELGNLGKSIDEVTTVMPEVKVMGARMMVMMRLLLSLVGAIFLLHGGYLAINSWMVPSSVPTV